MYKIYFSNKPLFIVSDTNMVEDYLHQQTTIYMDELSANSVDTLIFEMGQDAIETGILLHPDIDEALEMFKKKYTVIIAAGGFVYTEEPKFLFIYRRGKWDLPKGKLDEGETIEDCAVREVMEETGLKELSLQKHILTTYHTYTEKKDPILKETHWYLMKASEQDLKPQTDEDIERCDWVKAEDLPHYLIGAYALVRDVTEKGILLIDNQQQ